jgi:hypothetical protein
VAGSDIAKSAFEAIADRGKGGLPPLVAAAIGETGKESVP